MKQAGTYLLHFDKPVKPTFVRMSDWGDREHYVGRSSNLDERIAQHAKGKGSKVTQMARSQDIGFEVGFAISESSRVLEVEMTKTPGAYCMICATRTSIPL